MKNLSPFELAVSTAASRRLTRLVTKDEITRPIREHEFFDNHEKLRYLVNCPMCVSVYTAAFTAVSSTLFPKATKVLLYALAMSEVQSTLTELEAQKDALVDDYGSSL
jgi:hypothetical protein